MQIKPFFTILLNAPIQSFRICCCDGGRRGRREQRSDGGSRGKRGPVMTLKDLKGRTIAFAASGGLDSCTITRWLTELGVRVVAFTADMAQPDEPDFDAVRVRMLASGAVDFVSVPLRDAIAEAGLEIIQAQAC